MRARIGTPRMSEAGTSTSFIVAAIAIETFIGSGLPQTSATACVSASAAVDRAAGDAAFVRKRDHPLRARIDRLVQGMAVAGDRPAAPRDSSRATAQRGLVDRGRRRRRGPGRRRSACGRDRPRRGSPCRNPARRPRPRPAAPRDRRHRSCAPPGPTASAHVRRSRPGSDRERSAGPRSAPGRSRARRRIR